MVAKLSITVTDEQAKHIREQVRAGRFASASELVRSALTRLQDTDDQEYERRIASIRDRVREALDSPVRHTSQEIADHIATLARSASSRRHA